MAEAAVARHLGTPPRAGWGRLRAGSGGSRSRPVALQGRGQLAIVSRPTLEGAALGLELAADAVQARGHREPVEPVEQRRQQQAGLREQARAVRLQQLPRTASVILATCKFSEPRRRVLPGAAVPRDWGNGPWSRHPVMRRKRRNTTRRDPQAAVAADRVKRQFSASEPNRLWVADITYVPTLEGFVFLAMVLDVFSRKIVGWAMCARQTVELVQTALTMAVQMRGARGVVFHSDRGSQYTAVAFTRQCAAVGIERLMEAVGNCYDKTRRERGCVPVDTIQ